MRRSFAAVAAGLFALVAAATLTACSTTSSSEEQFKFKDQKGRACSVKRFPPVALCDSTAAPSGTCAAGSSPCFIVSTGQLERTDAGFTGPYYVRNCDGCCNNQANSSSHVNTDCSIITCTTAADCAGEAADCTSGRCVARR